MIKDKFPKTVKVFGSRMNISPRPGTTVAWGARKGLALELWETNHPIGPGHRWYVRLAFQTSGDGGRGTAEATGRSYGSTPQKAVDGACKLVFDSYRAFSEALGYEVEE